jgi:hypothetical protein
MTITLYRVAHRQPDGPVRELFRTTMLSSAMLAAHRWERRLRRNDAGGEVVIVNLRTGDVIAVYPVAGPAADR